jgi:hypothetical protein
VSLQTTGANVYKKVRVGTGQNTKLIRGFYHLEKMF